MSEALRRPMPGPGANPETPELVVATPTAEQLDFAGQLQESQTPLDQPDLATEYVGRHRAEYEGQHRATETLESGRHRAIEDEARNPNRFISRVANRVASLAERIGNSASNRRTTKELASEKMERGREIGRKVGRGIVDEVQRTKSDFMENVREHGQTIKEIGRDGKAAVKGFLKKRHEAAVQHKVALLEKGRSAWETGKRTGKKVGKAAMVGAGVAVVLPLAATGAAAYGVAKGGERVAKAAKSEYDEFKVNVQREWQHNKAEYNHNKVRKHLAKAERKAAKAIDAREKLSKLQ